MFDLIVIGAGLSGLMAACEAARAGLRVRVVNKGMGALHWSAGTIDVLGTLPDAPGELVSEPFAALERLLALRPKHPYGIIGRSTLTTALDRFTALTDFLNLPYRGSDHPEKNLRLPSPVGAIRPVYLAPLAQRAGDLDRPEPMVIVGLHGMRDFYPQLLAENLRKQGFAARAAAVPLTVLTDRHDINSVQLAELLDNPQRCEALAHELRLIAQPGERIGLPAILGLHQHTRTRLLLEQLTRATVFEIPTTPPSVPGIRLFYALQGHLAAQNVRIETGMEVISANTTPTNGVPGRVLSVASATSARPLVHHARSWLLATGGLLGGGFNSDHDGRVWETIFNLPLTVPQERSGWFEPAFLSPQGHPVFTGGVAVDGMMRPVDADNRPIYHNLHAAGHLLADCDPILERSLEGVALASALAAAQALCNHLQTEAH